jgi:hypothetical protein
MAENDRPYTKTIAEQSISSQIPLGSVMEFQEILTKNSNMHHFAATLDK